MSHRLPSWHATGLVEEAWKRVQPRGRDVLAKRMNVPGSDLSARNTSTDDKPRRMTLDYAERIVAAVRQDDPSFTVADLGAPSSVIVEADPTVLVRLEGLATKLADSIERQLKTEERVTRLQARVRALEARREPDTGVPRGSRP